tara:strand:+ start:459 stop:698 length:240 start_codon:yes stop_codon:yes gene_type:complete
MTTEERINAMEAYMYEDNIADEFLHSSRGRYVVAQALAYTIQKLEDERGLISNTLENTQDILDMKYLKDYFFDMPVTLH